jgi:carbon monoxide dehydrogenase subunit G
MPSMPLRLFAAFTLAAALGTAAAHGPTRQKVVEQVTIDAPADKVWAVVGNFDALKNWHPAVQSSPADRGNEAESQRLVTLKNGRTLSEKLENHDAAKMKYSYRAKDGGALPVTNYTSTLSVRADGAKSVVEWRGAFYRGHPNNDPPPDQNDDAAVKAVTEVYQAGLANLKTLLEKR